MDSSTLVRLFGFGATLIHGDTLVLDRWNWLKKRLPATRNQEQLLDVGCGTGAFSIGASLRGYDATGISWDERNQNVARERATMSGAKTAEFVIGDVRQLDQISELKSDYDVLICLECVEHILNDAKLFKDMADRMKPGATLLLTTPYYYYRPIVPGDQGPFLKEETGWHVRRGYTPAMLKELCDLAGLECCEISYCGGWISQKVTKIWRILEQWHWPIGLRWLLTLPLRVLPMVGMDRWITRLFGAPFFSIGLEAYKPRYPKNKA